MRRSWSSSAAVSLLYIVGPVGLQLIRRSTMATIDREVSYEEKKEVVEHVETANPAEANYVRNVGRSAIELTPGCARRSSWRERDQTLVAHIGSALSRCFRRVPLLVRQRLRWFPPLGYPLHALL